MSLDSTSKSKIRVFSIGKRKFSLDEFVGAVFNDNVEVQVNAASIEQLEQLSKKRFPPMKIDDCLNKFTTEFSETQSITTPIVRMILLIRAVSFLQARAAVRPAIVQFLVDLFNHNICPILPNPELATDQQIMSSLYESFVSDEPMCFFKKEKMSVKSACEKVNVTVPTLTANEVHRFVMGSVPTQAYYIFSAATAKGAARLADVVTALTCEAIGAFMEPFQQAYHDVARPYQTAIEVASIFRWLLEGSSNVNKPKTSDRVQNVEAIRQAPVISAALRDATAAVARAARIEINSAEAVGHINDWQHDPSLHPGYMASSCSSLVTASLQAATYSLQRSRCMLDTAEVNGPIACTPEAAQTVSAFLSSTFDSLSAEESTFCKASDSLSPLQSVFQCARVVYWFQRTLALEAFIATQLTAVRNKSAIEASEKAVIAKKEALARRNAMLAAEGKPIIVAKEKEDKNKDKSKGIVFGHGTALFIKYLTESGLFGTTTRPLPYTEANADYSLSDALSSYRSLLCPLKEETMSAVDVALTAVNQTFMPKLPKGTRDCGPELMAIREVAFDAITKCFQRHGAVGIDTPVFERKETLTGKYGEDSKLIYDLADQGGEILSLRYDLTVPFARFCATNGITNIKRYHIAKVYRRDQPQMNKGRFREFYQCDYDVAGIYPPMVADAETLKVMSEVLSSIDIGKFKIKLNHRRLLDAVMLVAGVPPEKLRPICSAVDKLDKETWATVKEEMCTEKGLPEEVADRLCRYVTLPPGEPYALLALLRQDSELAKNESAQIAFSELELLFDYLTAMQGLQYISFDMSLARGLDYYTGVIYEAVLTETDQVGSIAAGGRYDNLVGMFSGKQVPAVGVSIGIERIFAILEDRERAKLARIKTTKTQVLVASVGNNMLKSRMELTAQLWAAGIPAEFLYLENPPIRKQMEFAFDGQIPLVAWIGEDELRDGVVTLKTLTKDKDEASEANSVRREEIVDVIKKTLAAME